MKNLAVFSLSNDTILLILLIVLFALVVLLTILGIVFIVALRKRRPVVKVVMAPAVSQPEPAPAFVPAAPVAEQLEIDVPQPVEEAPVEETSNAVPEEEEDDEAPTYVTEGQESVRYNRSFTAKLCQLDNETKDWYSALKNELLSYDKIRERTSWKRESFRFGRMTVARIVVRGKTLCLLLAVEPVGYEGTKYKVEDVSNVANTVDTPTMFRIKSARRLKYAKEMIADIMKEIKAFKNPAYVAHDFFVPYEGDMALMQKGLVKRVVSTSTRVFKIEEVDSDELDNEVEPSENN